MVNLGKSYKESKAKQDKKKKNLLNSKIYLSKDKSDLLTAWIAKKQKYNKIEFNTQELAVLQSLDKIKKIKREGMYRVYQFISNIWNHQKSFYLILDGRNSIEITKSYEVKPQYLKIRGKK